MDWFLYDNDLRHERVKSNLLSVLEAISIIYIIQALHVKLQKNYSTIQKIHSHQALYLLVCLRINLQKFAKKLIRYTNINFEYYSLQD